MKRDFCSTVYIFNGDRVLLHLHPKFQKYLPAGGHLEENETPVEAAHREVLEETGLEISLIQDGEDNLSYSHAKSMEKPFLCLLENIDKPEPHQHIDFIYLGIPKEKTTPMTPFKYYSLEEVENLFAKGLVFEDVLFVIKKVLLGKSLLLTEKTFV